MLSSQKILEASRRAHHNITSAIQEVLYVLGDTIAADKQYAPQIGYGRAQEHVDHVECLLG